MRLFTLLAGLLFLAGSITAQTIWDLRGDWSELSNPNGAWRFCESGNTLPHVAAWEGQLHWPGFQQPGWAESENDTNRLPFWFRVIPENVYTNAWEPGDIIVHSTDGTNGVGNGNAELYWTCPAAAYYRLSGGLWFCRDISRSVHLTLLRTGELLAEGDLWSGDPYSRDNLLMLDEMALQPGSLDSLWMDAGDELKLVIQTTSTWGDFVGIRLSIEQRALPLQRPIIESILHQEGTVQLEITGLSLGATHVVQWRDGANSAWQEEELDVLQGSTIASWNQTPPPDLPLRLYRVVSRRGE